MFVKALSDAEQRARAAEDLAFESPPWPLIAGGVVAGIAWVAVSGWFVAVVLGQPRWAMTPAIGGLPVGVAVVLLPLLVRKRREKWIVLNGAPCEGRVVAHRLVGLASSGEGLRADDNYPVVRAQVAFVDPQGQERTGWAKRTVRSLKLRDLDELGGRTLLVYWHPRYPDQVVPADARL